MCLLICQHFFCNRIHEFFYGKSLGFYRDLAAGKLEGKRKKDAAVILAIAAAVILLIISGCVIFLNYFMGASILPSFDWMTLHIAAAIVSFLLMLLHMKQEWS